MTSRRVCLQPGPCRLAVSTTNQGHRTAWQMSTVVRPFTVSPEAKLGSPSDIHLQFLYFIVGKLFFLTER